MNQTLSPEPVRLRPDMVSLRLHVLGFVRRYIGRHHYSPSQGEIAAALDTTRTAVKDALRSLEREGLLLRTPGQRGLKMPSERDAALRVLRALGWSVAEAECMVAPPSGQHQPLPDFPLPQPPLPAYPVKRRRSRRSRSKGGAAQHDNSSADSASPPDPAQPLQPPQPLSPRKPVARAARRCPPSGGQR